jgi:hypothetical protein
MLGGVPAGDARISAHGDCCADDYEKPPGAVSHSPLAWGQKGFDSSRSDTGRRQGALSQESGERFGQDALAHFGYAPRDFREVVVLCSELALTRVGIR